MNLEIPKSKPKGACNKNPILKKVFNFSKAKIFKCPEIILLKIWSLISATKEKLTLISNRRVNFLIPFSRKDYLKIISKYIKKLIKLFSPKIRQEIMKKMITVLATLIISLLILKKKILTLIMKTLLFYSSKNSTRKIKVLLSILILKMNKI